MTKYRLLPQKQMSLRVRWKLVLLAVIMLALGIYDQFTEILGPNWVAIWLALGAVLILWLYYALLMPRAAIHVAPGHIRLQGPLYGRKVSFKRISSVSAGKLDQHYPYEMLSLNERPILKPIYQRTCAFVELNSYPKAFKRRRWWFPRTMFGTRKKGLLCYVDDWMALSQDLESVRARHLATNGDDSKRQRLTLVGRILAEDVEFT
jgi:hypothetical protein